MQDISKRCSYMTEVMLDRLRAESHSDHLRSSFQAFDLPRMVDGRLDRPYDPGTSNSVRRACIRGIRALAVALEVDADCAALEYIDVSLVICTEAAALTAPDNRQLWWPWVGCRSIFAHRMAPIVNLQAIIRFYLSVLDGECQAERDLGAVLDEASEHCNLQIDGIGDLMIMRGGGLQGPADFGRLECQGTTRLTDFTKTCLKLWRGVYGCRYGSYDSKPRVQSR